MSFHNYEWAAEVLATARNKSAGKPLQNNTRLFAREDGSYAVKLHAVDVVTINSDGTFTLRNGGWNTVTTLDRIRNYAPVNFTLFSERGEWFLRTEPSEEDPKPDYVARTVPKPFTPTWTPYPEPVKNDNGCEAGSMMGTEHKDELIRIFRKDMLESDRMVDDPAKMVKGSYDFVEVSRTWTSWVFYGKEAHSYQSKEWEAVADKSDTKYEQCPHCKAFDAEHERWRYGMYGDRWGTRFDQQTGYAKYLEMMTKYHNDKDLWQDAYIADFRARRAYLKAEREWDQRNRVPFYDGIIVNSDGYVARLRKDGPSPAKLRRHERDVAKVKKAIDKYVDGFIAELRKETMPMPSGGDCWYCSLTQVEDGTPMGDAMPTLHSDGSQTIQPNHDHLLHHIEERYYVPSLAVNALRERGYKDVGIYMILDMNPEGGTMGRADGRYNDVKRDLRKYMGKRLIPQAPCQ